MDTQDPFMKDEELQANPSSGMTRSIDRNDMLLRLVSRAPAGLSVGEIESSGVAATTRRTLQRRLARLVDEGRLQTVGRGKGTRYFVGTRSPSTAGGYHHTLISDYRPNTDVYLSNATRQGFRALNRALRAGHARAVGPQAHLIPLLAPYWAPDIVWNSSRMTGIRYTEREAEQFLQTGGLVPTKPLHDAQTLLNHDAAVAFLQKQDTVVNELVLRNLHAILMENLLFDPGTYGRLRRMRYTAPPREPGDVLRQLVEKTNAIGDPFEQSFFLFLHLSSLQLFDQGNLRLARTAANIPLLRADLCPITFLYTPVAVYHHALYEVKASLRYQVLHNLYADAYEESCRHYATAPTPNTINPLRLHYHAELSCMVRHIVEAGMTRPQAASYLACRECQSASELPSAIYELILPEIDSLHAGNVVKHGLSVETFLAWKQLWS